MPFSLLKSVTQNWVAASKIMKQCNGFIYSWIYKEKVSSMKIIQNHDQACLLVIYRKCSEMDIQNSPSEIF